MRSGNPALNDEVFQSLAHQAVSPSQTMTIQGTANKTLILLGLCIGTASLAWSQVWGANPQALMPWLIGGGITGFAIAIALCFQPAWSPILAPVYALAKGIALGAISAFAEARFPGIALQAVGLTFGILFALLIAYQTRIIRATENFKLGVFAATGGIALLYLTTMVLGFFGIHVPYIHESGLIGIGFSAFVVVIAALNLVLDFDYIENASAQGAPKWAEWYGAFGLLVTLVWLYIEVLRLLMKLQSRD